jgi:hypothetical protein
MQHRQYHSSRLRYRVLASGVLFAAAVASVTIGDPLLHAGPKSACQANADYRGGVDTNGNAVVPADVGAPKIPMPDAVIVPLHGRRGGEIVMDGARLAPLLKTPACN